MIWLLNALGWAKTALTVLADLARRYPCQVALVVALAACAWLWRGWDKALAWEDAYKAQKAAFVAARKAAEVKAIAVRLKTERKYRDSANAADNQSSDLDISSRRNLANRVRSEAPRCSPGGTTSAAVPSGAAVNIDPNSASVSFTLAEAEILRRHEVRSTVCEWWASDLIARGLAVESPN